MELLDYINEEQDFSINEALGDLKALRAELKKHKISPRSLSVKSGGVYRGAYLTVKDISVNIHHIYDAIEKSNFGTDYSIEEDGASIIKSFSKNPIFGELVETLYSTLAQKKDDIVVFYKKGAISIKVNKEEVELRSNQSDLIDTDYHSISKTSFVDKDYSHYRLNDSNKQTMIGRIGYDLVKSGILLKLDLKTLKASLESVKRGETITADEQETLKTEELAKYVLNKFRAKYKDLDAKIEMYDEKTIRVNIDNLNYMPEVLIMELGEFLDKCIQTVSKEKNISIEYIDNNVEFLVRTSKDYYRFYGADSKIFNTVVYNIFMASKIEEKLKKSTKITPINIYSDGANRIDLGFRVDDEYSAGYDQYYSYETMFFNIKSAKALTDKDGVKKKELTINASNHIPVSGSYIGTQSYMIHEVTTLLKVMGFNFKADKLVSVDGTNYKRAVIRAENETDHKPADFYIPTQIHKALRERFKGRLDVFEDSYKVFIDVYDKTLTNDEISKALEEIEDQVFDDIEKTYGIPKKELVSYINDADYRVNQKENPNKEKNTVTSTENITQNIQANTEPKDRASTIESIKNEIIANFKNTVTSEDGQTYKVTIPQTHPYDVVVMFGEAWKKSAYRNERQPNINVVYDNSLIEMYNSDPTFIKLKEKILKESKFETSIPQMIYEDQYGNSIEFEYTGYESGILNFYSKSIRDMNIGTKETYQGIDVIVRQDGIMTNDGTYSLAEIIMLTLFPIYDGGVID